MNQALIHRGPDGEGQTLQGPAGLAMRRLAIIDVQGGSQPITNEDGSLWLVLNGEIYNYPELRVDLLSRGHSFSTHSDVETMLHLYEEQGPAGCASLRGMFAFALWDTKRSRLVLGRDRLGKKPLYYTFQDGAFYFSSELPSLIAGLKRKPALIPQAVDDYLSLQYIPEPGTIYEGVYAVPPGHYAVLADGQLRLESYWNINYMPKHTAPEAELVEELRELVTESVRIRLMSEVPLGAHLSGGLDSSIVVSLMARLSGTPVRTFSIGFDEGGFSELPYARAVAEKYQTDHTEFNLKYDNLPETIAAVTRHAGQPLADPAAIPLYLLSIETRKHVTVALNGDGGDESLAGYTRYRMDALADAYLRLPGWITAGLVPTAANRIAAPLGKPAGTTWQDGMKRLANLPRINPQASILRWGSYFSAPQKQALWRPELASQLNHLRAEDYLAGLYQSAPAEHRLDRTLYADMLGYLAGGLLVKADRMTMAASLEGRSPLLDHVYFEWCARLPVQYKIHGRQGKYLLRRAFADILPAAQHSIRKQGFSVPVGSWFKDQLAEWVAHKLTSQNSRLHEWLEPGEITKLLAEHRAGRVDHGKRIYALVVLEEWLANS
jgi:asparagine synthase (glutamine-hydrolysing)